MNELSPREKRQQRTHQAILDAARQLINEKGVDGLSMRAIAERIEYSPAGLYEYFGSKEEIIGAIAMQGHQRLTAYLDGIDRSLPPRDYLIGIGVAYVEFAVHNPDFFLLMFTHTSSTTANVTELAAEVAHEMQPGSAFVILVRGIERGVREGVFLVRASFGVFDMAFAAWSIVHGIAMLRITNLRHFQGDFDTLTRETLTAFTNGLVTPLVS
jgi:AcrR family transcriptional regulator